MRNETQGKYIFYRDQNRKKQCVEYLLSRRAKLGQAWQWDTPGTGSQVR